MLGEILTGVLLRPALSIFVVSIATGVVLQAALPPAVAGALPAQYVFSPDNWWNQDISGAPVDQNSAAYIAFVSGRTGSNTTAERQMHPDFGPSPYGIPYVVVSGDQPLVTPTWVAYGDESDAGAPGRAPGYPIPTEAKAQAGY